MDMDILHGLTHLVHNHVKPLAQATSKIGMASRITSVEPMLSVSKPISIIPSYVAPIWTTYIQQFNPPISSLTISSLPMSVPPTSFPITQPSYNSVPCTYPSPPTMVPNVPTIAPFILANFYTLPSVSNVSLPPISSIDSTIISIVLFFSSLKQQLASLT